MARIRTIKPEFWTDDAITECSLSARLLFIGTWNFADDAGNVDRSAKQLKARVFPIDAIDCEPLLLELIAHGLLIEYSVNDKKYLHIPGFADHQVINRPSKPSCPDYLESLNTPVSLTEPSVSTLAGREGKGREGSKRKSVSPMTLMSDDWPMSAELAIYATKTLPDVNPSEMFAKFCDQAKAKAWKYADWDRAFQTYCRNAAKGSGHFAAGQYPRKQGDDQWSRIT